MFIKQRINVKILIKTTKFDEIERELKHSVEKFKKEGFKLNRATKFALKLVGIDLKTFNESIFMDYKKTKDGFLFEVNYPNIQYTKGYLINNLTKELKKIDEKVKVNEIQDKIL